MVTNTAFSQPESPKEERMPCAFEQFPVLVRALLTGATLVLAVTVYPAMAEVATQNLVVAGEKNSTTMQVQTAKNETEAGLSLKECVQVALENNRTLEIARQKVRQSEGEYVQARSGYLPHFGIEGSYKYIERKSGDGLDNNGAATRSQSTGNQHDDVAYGAVRLSQLIYDFGKTTGAMDTSRLNTLAAEAFLKKQTNLIVFQAKKEFYNILEKMRLIEIASETAKSFDQHLERTKKYHAAGVRTRVDIINAEVELSNANMNLTRARYNLKIAQAAFDQVLGVQPGRSRYTPKNGAVNIDKIGAALPPVATDADGLIQNALRNRPDLTQIHRLIKAAETNLTRVKGDYFPTIKAEARYNDYTTKLSLYQDSVEAGLVLSWDLFSGFQTEGAVATAMARLMEQRAQLEDLQLAIHREVTESWLKAAENRESVLIAGQTMQLAKENLVLAEKRYQTGSYEVLEFNEAQRSLTKARSELVANYYGYLTSLAGLDYAVGN
jgi:outer membrane protein